MLCRPRVFQYFPCLGSLLQARSQKENAFLTKVMALADMFPFTSHSCGLTWRATLSPMSRSWGITCDLRACASRIGPSQSSRR